MKNYFRSYYFYNKNKREQKELTKSYIHSFCPTVNNSGEFWVLICIRFI